MPAKQTLRQVKTVRVEMSKARAEGSESVRHQGIQTDLQQLAKTLAGKVELGEMSAGCSELVPLTVRKGSLGLVILEYFRQVSWSWQKSEAKSRRFGEGHPTSGDWMYGRVRT